MVVVRFPCIRLQMQGGLHLWCTLRSPCSHPCAMTLLACCRGMHAHAFKGQLFLYRLGCLPQKTSTPMVRRSCFGVLAKRLLPRMTRSTFAMSCTWSQMWFQSARSGSSRSSRCFRRRQTLSGPRGRSRGQMVAAWRLGRKEFSDIISTATHFTTSPTGRLPIWCADRNKPMQSHLCTTSRSRCSWRTSRTNTFTATSIQISYPTSEDSL